MVRSDCFIYDPAAIQAENNPMITLSILFR